MSANTVVPFPIADVEESRTFLIGIMIDFLLAIAGKSR